MEECFIEARKQGPMVEDFEKQDFEKQDEVSALMENTPESLS